MIQPCDSKRLDEVGDGKPECDEVADEDLSILVPVKKNRLNYTSNISTIDF